MLNKILSKYNSISVVAKSAFWFIVCSFFQKAISLVTTPIFTRLFTTEEYGQFAIYTSWLEIIGIFVTLKLGEAVFNKALVSNESVGREVLASFQAISIFLWAAYVVIFAVFRRYFVAIFQLPQEFIMFMLVQIFCENVIKLWTAYQRYNYKYRFLIVVSLFVAVCNPLLGIILMKYFSNKVVARIVGICLSVGIFSAPLLAYNLKAIRLNEILKIGKYALVFNFPLLPHYLSQVLLNQSDRIMISRFIDESSAALYSLAYTIGMLATMITLSINNAYVPWMYRRLKEKNIREINKYNQLLVVIVAAVILCVLFWAPEMILILGGTKYIEATSVVYPIAISVYFIFVYTLFANVELFYEKRKYVAWGTIVSAAMNVVLNIIFIPQYGYIAAAYTTLVCYMSYSAFHLLTANYVLRVNNIGEHLTIRTVIILGLMLLPCAFFSMMLKGYFVVRFLMFLVICSVVITKRKYIFSIINSMRK